MGKINLETCTVALKVLQKYYKLTLINGIFNALN